MAATITSLHRQWLIENYANLSNKECRAQLGCEYGRLKELVKECGLTWKSDTKAAQHKMSRYCDEASGHYCMDCKRYRTNGICGKDGRDIGALWQKKCFK